MNARRSHSVFPAGLACLAAMLVTTTAMLSAQQAPPARVAFLPTDLDVVTFLPFAKADSLPPERDIRPRFDSLLEAGLAARRFTVLDGAPAFRAWLRVRDSLGGFYDRKSGRRLEDKVGRAARAAAGAAGAELLLVPELQVVDVWLASRKAEWDGAERGNLPLGGRTPALSLVAELRDSSGAVVTTLRSGYTILTRYKGDKLVPLTRAEAFADRGRMRECTDRLADSMPGVPRKPPPEKEQRAIP